MITYVVAAVVGTEAAEHQINYLTTYIPIMVENSRVCYSEKRITSRVWIRPMLSGHTGRILALEGNGPPT